MALNFPAKIYEILENESADIIRWQPNGISFRIVDHSRFEREIIPKYFKRKYQPSCHIYSFFYRTLLDLCPDNNKASVQRQLNLYGFKCVNRGEDKGSFFHPQFKRGDWEVVKRITRYSPTSKKNDEDKCEPVSEKKFVIEVIPNPAPAVSTASSNVYVPCSFLPSSQELNQVADPFLQPFQHFSSVPHTPIPAPIVVPPEPLSQYAFTYPEHNAFHHSMDIQRASDYWDHWMQPQQPEAMAYPVMNHVPSVDHEFAPFAVDFDAASLRSTDVTAVPAIPKEHVHIPNELAKKPLVFSGTNNAVLINPDFDLEDEFGLFHDLSFPAPIAAPKPKIVDACVNTELTQSNNSIYQLYRTCLPF